MEQHTGKKEDKRIALYPKLYMLNADSEKMLCTLDLKCLWVGYVFIHMRLKYKISKTIPNKIYSLSQNQSNITLKKCRLDNVQTQRTQGKTLRLKAFFSFFQF